MDSGGVLQELIMMMKKNKINFITVIPKSKPSYINVYTFYVSVDNKENKSSTFLDFFFEKEKDFITAYNFILDYCRHNNPSMYNPLKKESFSSIYNFVIDVPRKEIDHFQKLLMLLKKQDLISKDVFNNYKKYEGIITNIHINGYYDEYGRHNSILINSKLDLQNNIYLQSENKIFNIEGEYCQLLCISELFEFNDSITNGKDTTLDFTYFHDESTQFYFTKMNVKNLSYYCVPDIINIDNKDIVDDNFVEVKICKDSFKLFDMNDNEILTGVKLINYNF